MSEIEPFDAAVRPKIGWVGPALFLLLGLGLGVGVMAVLNKPHQTPAKLAGLDPNAANQAPGTRGDDPGSVSRESENLDPLEAGSAQFPPSDLFRKGASAGAGNLELPAPADPPTAETGQGNSTEVPPALSGSLSGSLAPEGQRPMTPIVIEGGSGKPTELAYSELAGPVQEDGVEPLVLLVRRTVASAGGRVHFEFVWDLDRPENGREIVISVPLEKAEKLRAELTRIPALSEANRWTGAAGERHFRMEKFLRDAADRVETRLSQLRLKYHDDAPDVVRAAGSLDRLQKAMEALKPLGADREAIRVSIGKPAG